MSEKVLRTPVNNFMETYADFGLSLVENCCSDIRRALEVWNNNVHTWWQLSLQSNGSMHHYECVALCKDISLQRGRFCTRSLASCILRSSEDRSSWMFFIQVVRSCPRWSPPVLWRRFEDSLASAFSSIREIRARCLETWHCLGILGLSGNNFDDSPFNSPLSGTAQVICCQKTFTHSYSAYVVILLLNLIIICLAVVEVSGKIYCRRQVLC